MPSLLDTLETLFKTRDLYEALGFPKLEKNDDRKNITEGHIKKAYHKSSLKHHPDRAGEKDRKDATTKFQALGASYKILSDPDARALYDEGGEIDEENGDMDDKKDWADYWRLLFQKVTVSDIKKFEEQYRFSTEEDDDLKKAYCDGEGDMNFILDNVLCCTVEDDERFAKKLKDWITDKVVPEFSTFKKSITKAAKQKRRANRSAEAEEAEQHAADLGLYGATDNGEDALRNMIAKRQEKRAQESNNFLDALAAKYAKPEKKSKGGNKKK